MKEKKMTQREIKRILSGLDPEIFEEAASRISNYENALACIVLEKVAYGRPVHTRKEPYIEAFTGLFHPGPHVAVVWWRPSGLPGEEFSLDNCRDARVFALLLMAEMVKDARNKKRKKRK